jgi:hypothetical protein
MAGRGGISKEEAREFWGPWVPAPPGFDYAAHAAILGSMNARPAGAHGRHEPGSLMLVCVEARADRPGRDEVRYRFRRREDLPRAAPDLANAFSPPYEDWSGIMAPGGDQVQAE